MCFIYVDFWSSVDYLFKLINSIELLLRYANLIRWTQWSITRLTVTTQQNITCAFRLVVEKKIYTEKKTKLIS